MTSRRGVRYASGMGRLALAPNDLLLGKYRVERELGRGGMGVVVRARHLTLDEVVAIKVLSDELGITTEVFERFTREAKAAAKLKSQHTVRVTDVGRLDDGTPYMVMEMLEGSDLADLAKHNAPLAHSLIIDLVLQACEPLAEAHAMGIVHRDIKPSNLFVTSDGEGAPFVKLLDFGIAKAPDVSAVPITRTFSVLGTPGYMSPEQLKSSRNVDHRSDIWALGVMLYELLEERRPFDADALPALIMQIAMTQAQPATRMMPGLAAVVMRCLEKDPDHRFQSIEELATALQPFSSDPTHAGVAIQRMQRLARASAERSGDSTPMPRGRLDPTAAIARATPPHAVAALPQDAVATAVERPGSARDDRSRDVAGEMTRRPTTIAFRRLGTIAALLLAAVSIAAVVVINVRPELLTREETVAPAPAAVPVAAPVNTAPPPPPAPQPTTTPPPPAPTPIETQEAKPVEEPTAAEPPLSETTKKKKRTPRTDRKPATSEEPQPKKEEPRVPAGSDAPCDPFKSRFGC